MEEGDSIKAHDAWFRTEIEKAMAEADDPSVERVPHEVVMASWRVWRAALLERIRQIEGEDPKAQSQ